MKKIAIIGGLSMMTMGGGYMIHHKQSITPKFNLNPNTLAIASGGMFLALGLTYRF
jgi:hypothetical protein|tara:strand:- start:243 stop:410 length:168 start_codon:yes stop_codon:yes gene_type:complete